MNRYQFTVERIETEQGKLDLEVSVKCPYQPQVKDPKIAVIFDNGKQTRRIPIVSCSYDILGDGNCFIYAKYTYDLQHIFFGEAGGKKITLWFSLIYGDDEIVHEPFVLGSEEKMKKRSSSTKTGRQKCGEVLPYRVSYAKDLSEAYLLSDMEPYVAGSGRKLLSGLQSVLVGLWKLVELLVSILFIPLFLIDGLLCLTGCMPRKSSIENGGVLYVLKHVRWRMDSFTGMRIGILGAKMMMMHLMNWIGRHRKIQENQVVFFSNRRKDLTGNFEFVYNELKSNPEIQFRFVLSDRETKNLRFREYMRIGYYFGCSKIILVDDFLELLFQMPRRSGTKLIQLWHACGAFKTFGYTRLGKEGGQRQDSPNHRNYDYTTVSSQEIAKFYAEGFGLSLEKVVATGVPRTDVFFDKTYQEHVTRRFYERYPQLKDRKILLFAPTFRGNGKNSGFYPTEQFDVNALYEQLGEEYAIIIKHHPFVRGRNKIQKKYKDYILDMSDNSELNDLLFVTDLLITDYSSAVFEASLLDIPMLFYVYDLHQYIATRGFYYEYETFVPGKIVFDFEEIAPAIRAGDLHQEKIEPFKKRFFDGLDGKSAKRTADLIYQCMGKCDILGDAKEK